MADGKKLKKQRKQLTTFVPRKKDVPDATKSRALIEKYLQKYKNISGLFQPKASYMGQPVHYEPEKMLTALKNNIKDPIKLAKDQVQYGHILPNGLDDKTYNLVKVLQPVLAAYQNTILHEKIYYDIKCDPVKHIKTFFLLARFFQQNKLRSFQCMPLRTQWIPCHVHIDKAILCQWFLGGIKKEQKLTNDLWGEVLDINCRVVKSKQSGKVFEGSVQTDGVSISIFKKCKAKKKNTNSTHQTSDIKTLDTASTATTKTSYPGRRDLLFCMHEYSSIGNPWLFRFTHSHKAKLTRSTKFRRILEAVRKIYPNNAIIEAEQRLAEVSCTTVDPDEFKRFIEVQAEVWPLLSKFYSCTQTNSTTNKKPLHRQLRLAAYLNSQRSDHTLANLIREQFGPDPVLVLGNWSAGMCKYHEPIRGVGMRGILRKHGFKVYLLDEFPWYRSSSSKEAQEIRERHQEVCQWLYAAQKEATFSNIAAQNAIPLSEIVAAVLTSTIFSLGVIALQLSRTVLGRN
ncbi:hypothetical protein IW138_004027 [Coemansia sp. RSA 986]|nr:hypothetical protein IW138_004027 [Coemansia sp. RSA 986]